jgi:hypothetical protein
MTDWCIGDQVRGIAGRYLSGQLRIAGPGDDVELQPDVRILRLELVEQRGEDTASPSAARTSVLEP